MQSRLLFYRNPASQIIFHMAQTYTYESTERDNGANGWRWVPPLYVFQGVPSCLVMTTSALLYSDMGVSMTSFAFWTSLVCLPWSLKPLWSPFVERYSSKAQWVRLSQVVLVLAFVSLALSMLTPVFYPLSLALMLVVAMASSCHDIACDGFYMMALSESQQSFFVGIRSTFYRIAMVATTGLVPLVVGLVKDSSGDPSSSAAYGWAAGIGLSAFILLVMAVLCRIGMPAIRESNGRQDDSLQIFIRALRSFFSHPGAIAAVAFFFVYRLGEALITKAVLPFLNSSRAEGGLGLDVAECGIIYGTYGVIALVAGGILGGILASRIGLRRALWPMIAFMNVPNVAYVILAHFMPDTTSLWIPAAVMIEQFGYGFGFTAYMLVMLNYVADAEYKAAEYAIGTSIMSLSLIIPGMVAGYLKENILGDSYELLFVVACLATIPGIIAALFLKIKEAAKD